MENIVDFVIGSVILGVVVSGLYIMFVFLPVGLYAEAECLRNGYPEYRVSVGLERYCMTLDGTVTVRVDKRS